MNLRDRIDTLRNIAVANMSEVEQVKDNGSRVIKNGKDRYTVEKTNDVKEKDYFSAGDPDFDPTIARTDFVCFNVTDSDGNSQAVTVEKRKIISDGYRKIKLCEIGFGKSARYGLELSDDTDINDINSIRYQLDKSKDDKAKQFAHFIDKFVIVAPKERKAYKEYANKMNKLARDKQREQELRQRVQQKEQEEKAKRERQEAKNRETQEKNRAKTERRIQARFIGRGESTGR